MSPTSPSSASAENQPPEATDPLAWRQHIPSLASAATGIKQASNAWDGVSDSFCDIAGWPVDEKGYAEGKVKRDAEAWKHVEVFLDRGPEVLVGVRAAADGSDYVEGPISDDLYRLRGIETTLQRAGQLRHEWNQIMALMDASLPGSRALYQERAEEDRNSDGWHYADELSHQGPALVRAAEYLTERADAERPPQTERVRAALARSAPGNRGVPSEAPPAAPALSRVSAALASSPSAGQRTVGPGVPTEPSARAVPPPTCPSSAPGR
ncbi:hypothetical protein [Streptomyces goshikiensis]|uniref:hypothetical protein n=1 Tax=Streptomyces goshikiensis TaxID=1942 RepID=UPI0036B7F1BD